MDAEIAWFIGACLMAWCLGFGAGMWHRSFVQMLESSTS